MSLASRPPTPIPTELLYEVVNASYFEPFQTILSPQIEEIDRMGGGSPISANDGVQSISTEPESIVVVENPAIPHSGRRPQALRRSKSSSQLEIRPRSGDIHVESARLRKRLIEQTSHTGTPPVRPWRVHRVRTSPSPFEWMDPQNPKSPGFRWIPRRTTVSEPSTQLKPSFQGGTPVPLKTILKHSPNSITPMSSSQPEPSSGNMRPLRRSKTVEFKEIARDHSVSLPPLQAWVGENHGHKGHPKRLQRISSYPGPTIKSKAADTVTTRTDVHVVTIAPSWTVEQQAVTDDHGIDPSKHMMQIVESEHGIYEVVWDDLTPDDMGLNLDDIRLCTNSPEQPIDPLETPGLHQVNSKLTEWFWCRGPPPPAIPESPPQPSVAAFQDDSQPPLPRYFDSILDEDEDDDVLSVPPNSSASRPPSQEHSRRPSRPASHPGTPAPSRIPLNVSGRPQQDPEQTNLFKVRIISPELTGKEPTESVSPLRHRPTPKLRRLSNIEESELKFRWHRDSVALARERMYHVGGASPELHMRRESSARRHYRMFRKYHAMSAPRQAPRKSRVSDEALHEYGEVDDSGMDILKLPGPASDEIGDAEESIVVPRARTPTGHVRSPSEAGIDGDNESGEST